MPGGYHPLKKFQPQKLWERVNRKLREYHPLKELKGWKLWERLKRKLSSYHPLRELKRRRLEKQSRRVLRGYHPLTELKRWNLLIATLISPLILFLISAYAIYQPLPARWTALWIGLYCGLFVLIYMLFTIPLSMEQRRLRRLRLAVLKGQEWPVLRIPSNVVQDERSALPFTSRTRLRYRAFIWPVLSLLVAMSGILFVQLPLLLPDPYAFPDLLWISAPVLSTLLICFNASAILAFWRVTTELYLFPQLELDADGITASYASDVVRIAWQNVRYFALLESSTFRLYRRRFDAVIYELGDGENTINWSVRASMKTRQPLSPLDANAYATSFCNHLPALVSASIALPLLDLRPKKWRIPLLDEVMIEEEPVVKEEAVAESVTEEITVAKVVEEVIIEAPFAGKTVTEEKAVEPVTIEELITQELVAE